MLKCTLNGFSAKPRRPLGLLVPPGDEYPHSMVKWGLLGSRGWWSSISIIGDMILKVHMMLDLSNPQG